MLKTISDDAILTHLAICPMTASELAGDLHVEPMAMAGMLVYSLPGYREPARPNFAEARTARDYGAIYSGGYGD